MSNSEWTELPNWKEPMEYAFLDSAEPELWAWEFLRRHPLYRRYWQRLSNFINKTEDNWNCTVYSPPKHSEETVKNWERRVWYHKNIFPTKTTLIERLGQKWGLQQLYDPSQQFNQGVRFHKPKRIFPRMVFTPEQFLELIEDEMLKDDIIQRVANGLAVVAFDMARPLDKRQEKYYSTGKTR